MVVVCHMKGLGTQSSDLLEFFFYLIWGPSYGLVKVVEVVRSATLRRAWGRPQVT